MGEETNISEIMQLVEEIRERYPDIQLEEAVREAQRIYQPDEQYLETFEKTQIGKVIPVVPLTSGQILSKNFFISTLNTCRTHEVENECLNKLKRDIRKISAVNPSFARFLNGSISLLENLFRQTNPLQLVAMASDSVTNIYMNFVGRGDNDQVGVNRDPRSDLFHLYCAGTGLNLENLPTSTCIHGGGTLPVLFDNGSVSRALHVGGNIKAVTRNLLQLFGAAVQKRDLSGIENELIGLLPKYISLSGETTEEGVNAIIEFISTKLGINMPSIRLAVNETIQDAQTFPYDDVNAMVEMLFERIEHHEPGNSKLPSVILEFLPKQSTPIYTTLNNNDQMTPSEFGPIHYIQSFFCAIMMSTMNESVQAREIIFRNILRLIESLSSPTFDIQLATPLEFLTEAVLQNSGVSINMPDLMETTENIYHSLNAAEHVTQLEFLQLQQNMTLSNIILMNNGNLCVPLGRLLSIVEIEVPEEFKQMLWQGSLYNVMDENTELTKASTLYFIDPEYKPLLEAVILILQLSKTDIASLGQAELAVMIAAFKWQIVWLTREQIGWLTREQIGGLTREQIGWFTQEQIGCLRGEQIGCLTREQIGCLTREQIGWLRGEQIGCLTREQIGWLTQEQIGWLTRYQIGGLTQEQIGWLRWKIDWFTQDQIGGLTRDQIGGFTGDQIGCLTREQIRWFTREQIGGLTREQIGWLTKEQISWLTREKIGWLTREQIGGLTQEQIDWFTPWQIGWLTRDQIGWLTRDQIGGLTQDQIGWLTKEQISWLTRDQIGWLTREKIGWLTRDQIGWLTRDQIGWLTRDQIGWLTQDQIGWFTGDQIGGLTQEQIGWLTQDQIGWLTREQISWLSQEQRIVFFNRLTPNQFDLNDVLYDDDFIERALKGEFNEDNMLITKITLHIQFQCLLKHAQPEDISNMHKALRKFWGNNLPKQLRGKFLEISTLQLVFPIMEALIQLKPEFASMVLDGAVKGELNACLLNENSVDAERAMRILCGTMRFGTIDGLLSPNSQLDQRAKEFLAQARQDAIRTNCPNMFTETSIIMSKLWRAEVDRINFMQQEQTPQQSRFAPTK